MWDRWLQRIEAVVERQQRVAPESDDNRLFLHGQHCRSCLPGTGRKIGNRGPLLPFGDGFLVHPVAPAKALQAAASATSRCDQARRHTGKAGLDLATRPFLTQHNRATLIAAHDVERVLADIDTSHGNCRVHCLGHGVLLVSWRPWPAYRWRGEHGRTIPLTDISPLGPTPQNALRLGLLLPCGPATLIPDIRYWGRRDFARMASEAELSQRQADDVYSLGGRSKVFRCAPFDMSRPVFELIAGDALVQFFDRHHPASLGKL